MSQDGKKKRRHFLREKAAFSVEKGSLLSGVKRRDTLNLRGLADRIASRQMKEMCSFKQNMIYDLNGVPKKVRDGQLVDYGPEDEEQEDENNG